MTTSSSNETNKALLLAGIRGVFVERDPTVLDRLFSDDYRQHNPQIPNGTAAIKALLANLSRDFKYEPGLVVADGDYVSIHGHYTGWGPKPMIAVDIFRVANGKIVEHWDVISRETARPMLTPSEVIQHSPLCEILMRQVSCPTAFGAIGL